MAIEHVFSGNALCPVAADGGTILPHFIIETLYRRGGGRRLLFGAHEDDPCINGYDEAHQSRLQEDVERRRLTDEMRGVSPELHHRRARRVFGSVEGADIGEGGQTVLPTWARRRGRIGDRALFVGTGASFEVWDPETALAAGGEEMRELLELVLHPENPGRPAGKSDEAGFKPPRAER